MTERQAFTHFISRISKEGALIVLIVACSFLLLALCTFDALDPGWSHLGYTGQVRNAAGATGAWLADFSFSMLGYMAFLLPLMLIYRAWRFLRRIQQPWLSALPFVLLRTFGAVLMMGSGAALAAIHLSNQWLALPFEAGGIVGLSLASQSLQSLGLIGATLVLLGGLVLGVTLYTDLSWLALAQWLGAAVLDGFEWLRQVAGGHKASVQQGINRAAEAHDASASRLSQSEAPDSNQRQNKMLTSLLGWSNRVNKDDAAQAVPAADCTVETQPGKPTAVVSQGNNALKYQPSNSQNELEGRGLSAAEAELSDTDVLNELSSLDPRPASVVASMAEDRSDHPEASPGHKELKIIPLSETISALDESDSEPLSTKSMLAKPSIDKKQIPDVKILDEPEKKVSLGYTPEQLESMSRLLEAKLKDFGVIAEVVEVNPGPVITRFEIQPAPGTKVSKITNLAKDLARSMAVLSVRVVEVIAGKSVVGIEIPNENREMVRLREVLDAPVYTRAASKLSLGLGNDIAGNPVVVNLGKMPHLLVAGTTGSGKSVGVNAMILSLLYKATPDEVRLMMVDPKMLELSIYDGIPHLLTPVITDMKEAATGLRWCVAEMERRYKLMAKMGVRNLAGFNDKVLAAEARGEPILDPLWNPVEEGFDENAPAPALQTLPYIVVVIDEFADMMMIVGKKVEELIARIAQKARAAGIHLILATQRPSVDVITGLIKANVPTRIAFQVSSKIDSRTILDQGGAENLLGNGDMLYLPAGSSQPVRVHGAFVSDDEVHRSVEAWKQWGPADFVEEILMASVDMDTTSGMTGSLFEDEQDALYDEAVAFVTHSRRASISAVQRKLKIGYNRAARMVESMEAAGVVSEASHSGSREVLAPPPVSVN